MKKVNQIVYGLLGGVALLYGVTNLLVPTFMVREASQSFVLSHILREQGAMATFIGCLFLWCIFNYEQRRVVHYFLIVFAFLLAAIHWFDYFNGHLNWMSPLYNTIPVLLLTVMALGSRSEPKALTS
jgi:hypothetical protein